MMFVLERLLSDILDEETVEIRKTTKRTRKKEIDTMTKVKSKDHVTRSKSKKFQSKNSKLEDKENVTLTKCQKSNLIDSVPVLKEQNNGRQDYLVNKNFLVPNDTIIVPRTCGKSIATSTPMMKVVKPNPIDLPWLSPVLNNDSFVEELNQSMSPMLKKKAVNENTKITQCSVLLKDIICEKTDSLDDFKPLKKFVSVSINYVSLLFYIAILSLFQCDLRKNTDSELIFKI